MGRVKALLALLPLALCAWYLSAFADEAQDARTQQQIDIRRRQIAWRPDCACNGASRGAGNARDRRSAVFPPLRSARLLLRDLPFATRQTHSALAIERSARTRGSASGDGAVACVSRLARAGLDHAAAHHGLHEADALARANVSVASHHR